MIFGAMGASGVLLLLVIFYTMTLSDITSGAKKDSENLSDQIAYSLEFLAAKNDSFALQRVVEKSSTLEGVSRVIIVDTRQVIQAHTDSGMIGQEDASSLIAEVIQSGRNLSHVNGAQIIFIRPLHGQPFTSEHHDVIGALWVEIDITHSIENARGRFFEIGAVLFTTLILAYLAQYLLIKQIVIGRIFEIEKGIHNAIKGGLVSPVIVQKSFGSEDEINVLAQSYNYLISGLTKSQSKLQAERDFALQIMESMSEGLTLINAAGIFEYVNPAYAGFLGLPPQQMIGRTPCDFMAEDDRKVMLKEWEVRQRGTASSYESRLFHTSGAETRVLISAVPRYTDGVFSGSLAVITDISQRVRIEQMTADLQRKLTFEELTARLAAAFMNMPSGQIGGIIQQTLGQLGELFEVNRAYVFEFNHDSETVSNTFEWCADGISPQIGNRQDLPVETFPWWMQRLRKGETIVISNVSEMSNEAAAEQQFMLEQGIQSVLATPIYSDNQFYGFLGLDSVIRRRDWLKDEIQFLQVLMGIFMNAIARQRAEENLRVSEARNRAFLDAVPDLIFRIDSTGKFLDFLAGENQNLYVHQDQIIGNNIESLLPQDIASKTISLIRTALDKKQPQNFEYKLSTKDGESTYDAHIVPDLPGQVIIVSHDISERVHLEQMKTDFINRASHELRTPLTTAILMAELLEEEERDEQRIELFSILRYELNRQHILLNDLLMAGRLENGRVIYHLSDVDVLELVNEAVATVKPQADKRQNTVEIRPDPDLHTIKTNRQAMHQVILNLLSNAIKFSHPGGPVIAHVKNSETGIVISIQDFGIGIPAHDLEHIATRFFRAQNAIENEIQGTGIGLFIASETIKLLNGTLNIESVESQGTTIHIRHPLEPIRITGKLKG
jgi:PAS domain S-box-containing protein